MVDTIFYILQSHGCINIAPQNVITIYCRFSVIVGAPKRQSNTLFNCMRGNQCSEFDVTNSLPAGEFQKQPPEVFCKKRRSQKFRKFTGKHLSQILFFNKVAGLRPATLLKRESGKGVFLQILQNFQKHLFTERIWTTASDTNNF